MIQPPWGAKGEALGQQHGLQGAGVGVTSISCPSPVVRAALRPPLTIDLRRTGRKTVNVLDCMDILAPLRPQVNHFVKEPDEFFGAPGLAASQTSMTSSAAMKVSPVWVNSHSVRAR